MNNWREKLWLKFVAVTLCGVFLFTEVTWAARADITVSLPHDTVPATRNQIPQAEISNFISDILHDLTSFLVPSAYAAQKDPYSVMESSKKDSSGFVSIRGWKKLFESEMVKTVSNDDSDLTAAKISADVSTDKVADTVSDTVKNSQAEDSQPLSWNKQTLSAQNLFSNQNDAKFISSGSSNVVSSIISTLFKNSAVVENFNASISTGGSDQKSFSNVADTVDVNPFESSGQTVFAQNNVVSSVVPQINTDGSNGSNTVLNKGTPIQASADVDVNDNSNNNGSGTVVVPSKAVKTVQSNTKLTSQSDKLRTGSLNSGSAVVASTTDPEAATTKVESVKNPASVKIQISDSKGNVTVNGQTVTTTDSKTTSTNIQVKLDNNSQETVNPSVVIDNKGGIGNNIQVLSNQAEVPAQAATGVENRSDSQGKAAAESQVTQAHTGSVIRVEGVDSRTSQAITAGSINKDTDIQTLKSYSETGAQDAVSQKSGESYSFVRYIKMPELNGAVIPGGYRQPAETSTGNTYNSGSYNNKTQNDNVGVLSDIENTNIKESYSIIENTDDKIENLWKTQPPTGPPKASTERKPSFCCPSKDQTVSSNAAITVSSSKVTSNQATSKLSDSNQTPNRIHNDYFSQPIRGPGTEEANCAAQALSSYLGISNEEAVSLLKQYS
ncbi:MAG: hypothetical protein PHP35_02880, partial [Candidatus Colwellbacteria bacterium]|nr:hypothetical protein [Candidatus Colwellbacteria bacterium]